MYSPLISIIIPVYNVEKYIEKCLLSIIDDIKEFNRKKIEIILINDCTPDNSLKVVDKLIQNNNDIISVINHKENLGLGGARNTGLDNAKGKFITFLDSDDYYKKESINQLIEIVEGQNTLNILIFGFEALENKFVKWGFTPDQNKTILADEALTLLSEDKINPSVWNKIYPRRCLANLRFIPHTYYEDIEFTARAFQLSEKITFINKNLLNYRLEGPSITRSKTNFKHIEDLAQAINRVATYIEDNKIVSNIFFNRWAHHLSNWSLNEELATLSLKKIKDFTDKYQLYPDFNNSYLRFKLAFDKITLNYNTRENKILCKSIASNITQLNSIEGSEATSHILRENELLKLEVQNLLIQKEWYETTYESLPWWWKKVGALIKRLK